MTRLGAKRTTAESRESRSGRAHAARKQRRGKDCVRDLVASAIERHLRDKPADIRICADITGRPTFEVSALRDPNYRIDWLHVRALLTALRIPLSDALLRQVPADISDSQRNALLSERIDLLNELIAAH